MPKLVKKPDQKYRYLDQVLPWLASEYQYGKLTRKNLQRDPFKQFTRWFESALKASQEPPNVVSLATASESGKPTVRVVLVKGFDLKGFVFYSNYGSAKAKQIKINPRGEIVFHWAKQERQIRVSGHLTKLSRLESERYFQTRSKEAQLGAWASHQSKVLKSRSVLESRLTQIRNRFKGKQIPLPPFWGGYRLKPSRFEFWQGRKNRLNDRFVYSRSKNRWTIQCLEP